MLIIGLTGSIGMGKSTAAAWFRDKGIPVFDADAEVHRLYAGPAVTVIAEAFPGVVVDGSVERAHLSVALLADPSGFKRLEALIHPLVQASERQFLMEANQAGQPIAVLEIPLLFEIGADRKVDVTVVISAPAEIQQARVLGRPGMTPEKLAAILARQWPDADKRACADFVVDSRGEVLATHAQLQSVVDSLRGRQGTAFTAHWS